MFMKIQHLILAAFIVVTSSTTAPAAEPKKAAAAETPKSAAKKGESKAKQDTYPLYGKVVAITSRTLTITRSEAAEAEQSKYNVNASTEYVDGDKPGTIEAVKVGLWVGGSVKKAEGDGNDTVLKLNVGVKQKSAKKAGKAPKKKTETKPDAKKKTE
jgi:hypothetical protein